MYLTNGLAAENIVNVVSYWMVYCHNRNRHPAGCFACDNLHYMFFVEVFVRLYILALAISANRT